jgi:prepilin peptidase CpaA
MSAQTAMWLLPFVLPVALYIVWSDLRSMRISNRSVMLLFGVFVVIGPFAFGVPDYFYQLLQAPVVLVVGMLLWGLRLMGGGDAKLLAAMAPFIVLADIVAVLWIFVAASIGGLVTHSLFRFTPLHRIVPDWASWSARKGDLRGGLLGLDLAFPKGLVLAMTLVFYLGLALLG